MAKVYFTDLHTSNRVNLLDKTEHLCRDAGFADIDMKDKLVAIKLHFGEPGNLAFLRHNYAARLARMIKKAGGLPFVTDANTLYKGERADAVRHLAAACGNGYNELTVGCPIIIADGLRGHDQREIEINLKHFKKAYIASAIAEADVIITLNHFKGHSETGFGGAIKNIGMGCGSRDGKNQMHSGATPEIRTTKCVGCGECVAHCAYSAINLGPDHKAVIDEKLCVGCGQCVAVCNYNAAVVRWDHGGQALGERVVEYAAAALKNKVHFHVNFIVDVSPLCDCPGHNDVPITPNIGILASPDPVAVDVASADLTTQAPANMDSKIAKHIHKNSDGVGVDKFTALYPHSNWKETMKYAESAGIGSISYELVTKKYQ